MAVEGRWTTSEGKRYVKCIVRALGRKNATELPASPFGSHETRLDLRCIPLPRGMRVCNTTLVAVELSRATLLGARFEGNSFVDVDFTEADLSGLVELDNHFKRCLFDRTLLGESSLGYNGSSYTHCRFDKTYFGEHTHFIRAEFNHCDFLDCELRGVDFGASSFKSCTFAGLIEGVWFRGGFPLALDEADFGTPRPNRMQDVSFANARLFGCTFSDGCDLSTVTLPGDGTHRFVDFWEERLRGLQVAIQEWPEKEREEASIFVACHLRHCPKQQCYILNIDDLRKCHGRSAADKIFAYLTDTE